jgi:prevent-host-death family protein
MRKTSVHDLHARTSELVQDASRGAVIVIERRGEPVAELRPISKSHAKAKFPDAKRFWEEFPGAPRE